MSDFPWHPQIDGCRGCGATDPESCTCSGVIRGPATVWIAPVDTPLPDNPQDVYDPGGPWQLIHPSVPNTLPEGVTMKGRRLPDTRFGDHPDDVRPGDYWKILDRETGEPMKSDNPENLTGTCWHVAAPVEREWPIIGYLRNHTVREHEDGTISVRPQDGSSNSIAISDSNGEIYHGFIEHGVWSK